MDIDAHLPTELLSPFIRSYLVLEANEELVNRVMPDTSVVMAFRFKGQVRELSKESTRALSPSMVSGLRKAGRLINYSKNTGNIIVIFREAAANAFIKEPLNTLFDETVSLGNLCGYQHLADVEDQLAEAKDNVHRVKLIEDFLLSKLYNFKPDRLIIAALEKIHAANGSIKIKELAASLYISLDPFEKRFRRVVGISPKQFCYIVKMKSIIRKGITKHTLSDIAFDAGYSDQPHFNKDFKLFTGQTPTDFLKSPVFW
jgi:AraC-like DNA-binding protein